MRDWIKKLDAILVINGKEILSHAGRISRKIADKIANSTYEKFKKHKQLFEDKQALEQLKFEIKRLKGEERWWWKAFT